MTPISSAAAQTPAPLPLFSQSARPDTATSLIRAASALVAQRRSQAEQDGSEIKSVELERLLDQGQKLLDRRNSFESFRDHAADLFEVTRRPAFEQV